MQLLKTHEYNIPQIRAAVGAYGEVWVHGDGNMFPVYTYNPTEPNEQDHSKTHLENFNPGYEEASYRVKITAANMPKSKAELDRLLMDAKAYGEVLKHETTVGKSKVRNVAVTDQHYAGGDYVEPEGNIDYEKYRRDSK